jgi:hypothetical protein
MARFGSIVTLIVLGIIAADVITHGSQFAQAAQGFTSIENPAISGLLGKPPS